jgi:hypothetical protein
MADLNLGDLLTPGERAHYQRFLGGDTTIFVHPRQEQPWRWAATVVDGPPGTQRYAVIAELAERPTRDGILLPAGHGPAAATSCTELARSPEVCWDVCGYYARLGVAWGATKREIRRALIRRQADLTAGDAELTYAATQLLDDGLRRRYDRMPLGGLFLEDKDVVARLKAAAQRAASAMAARGFPQTPEDILGAWGFSVTPGGGPQGEGRGQSTPDPVPPSRQGDHLGLVDAANWLIRWTWYREPDVADWYGLRPGWLETWQKLLIREFARRGMRVRFAVGLSNARDGFRIRPAPDPSILVVLLGEGEPSPELAAAAVDEWGPAEQASRRGDI